MYLYFLAILVMVISLLIQFWLKATVSKWSKVDSGTRFTANDAVRRMFSENDINNIEIVAKSGSLTDCYSPNEGRIYLSEPVYNQSSVAAIAVAAHECGHAIQDKKGIAIYRFRQTLAIPASFCSQAGVYLAMIGLMLAASGYLLGETVLNVGIIMYMVTFLFYVAMVPVEIDASRRGLKAIKENGFISDEYIGGARSVLTAAGSTYVISMVSAGVTLLRLIGMRGNSRRS